MWPTQSGWVWFYFSFLRLCIHSIYTVNTKANLVHQKTLFNYKTFSLFFFYFFLFFVKWPDFSSFSIKTFFFLSSLGNRIWRHQDYLMWVFLPTTIRRSVNIWSPWHKDYFIFCTCSFFATRQVLTEWMRRIFFLLFSIAHLNGKEKKRKRKRQYIPEGRKYKE